MIIINCLDLCYKNIKDLDMVENSTVVAGVSGGADSMFLLNLLLKIRKNKKINIVVAHVHHNVRKESDNELEFVKEYCLNNNVIFESMKIEKKIISNFENEARNMRYDFFEKLVNKYNAKYLFTAHHGDDLIETILMRIVRGSNIHGYSGFKMITKRKNYYLVKPLINITKKEIYEYNKSNKIPWVEDYTNKENIHTRNRFRNNILPRLKDENERLNEKFLQFSENIIECSEYLDRCIKKVLPNVYKENKIIICEFIKQDMFIQKNILFEILRQIYEKKIELINSNHIKLIFDLIKKNGNGMIYLPNNIIVYKNYDFIEFKDGLKKQNGYNYIFNKKQDLPNGKKIELISSENGNSNYVCYLNSSEIKLPLIIRTRLNGDFMYVKNLNGRKKINDIFISSKINKDDRELWPVVTDSDNNVIWLPGLKKSKYDKQKDKKYDIILKYY